jgi:L-arabinose transport system permease protein
MNGRRHWPVGIMLLVLFLGWFTGSFHWPADFSSVLIWYGPFLILCFSMPLCLSAGRMDWSVGPVVFFACLASWMSYWETGSVICGLLGGVISGLLMGLVNGWMIGFMGLHSLLVTLSTGLFIHHIWKLLIDLSASWNHPDELNMNMISSNPFLGLTHPAWGMMAAGLVAMLLLCRSNLSLFATAIGNDASQLRRWPERASIILMGVYAAQGALAGWAGAMMAYSGTLPADLTENSSFLSLSVLCAGLLGGMGFHGGRPKLLSIICGMVTLIALQMMLRSSPHETHLQAALQSLVLMGTLIYHRYQQKVYAH